MRSISLVVVGAAFLLAGCMSGRRDGCVKAFGIDYNPPGEVLDFVNKKTKGLQLVDRVDCATETMWTAIPEGMSSGIPRNPGVGALIRLDKKNHRVEFFSGE